MANNSKVEFPTEIILSLATAPVLIGILSLEAIASGLQAAGISSEEVFRGDRLPILHLSSMRQRVDR
ncbi:MAG: hypothetical protein HC881_03440 [Leptolyngbyaceae cyanobacterium SL_7_1]|nr:hypothetical protein [Leptolyngbyaceae cyanobacterium SL_7_1]